MATVTNTSSQPSQRGQSVLVRVTDADMVSVLASIPVGTSVSCGSNTGLVSKIDTYGNGFYITPKNPTKSFSGATNGYFLSTETVTY